MDLSDRRVLLETAAREAGLEVRIWDPVHRVLIDADENQLAYSTWIQSVCTEHRERMDAWLLGVGGSADVSPIEWTTDDGIRRRFAKLGSSGSRVALAQQDVDPEAAAVRGALQEFLYAVSHDLQEPLRMVKSYVELIERRHGDALPGPAREHMDYVVDGSQRLQEMITALLTLSRIETRGGVFESIDLGLLVSEVVEDMRPEIDESGADVTVEPLPTIRGDEKQLFRVFYELLDNALKFGGDSAPVVRIHGETIDGWHHVVVADRGLTLHVKDAERIFRPFGRLHSRDAHPGLGMGLALVRRIVTRHGGRVELDTTVDGWNRFVLKLPA